MNSQPLQTDPSTTAPQTQPSAPTTPVQETTVPTEPIVNSIALECTVNMISHSMNHVPDVQWPVVIKSTAQLCALLQEWDSYTDAFSERLIEDRCEFYNDDFFKENTLVLICFYAQPGYSTCIVEECLKMDDGSYSIALAEPERSFGGALADFIFLGLNVADDIPLDAVVQIHFDDTDNMLLIRKGTL